MNDLRQDAMHVLLGNEAGGYIAPARGLYTHQHLWDTCFTAIGQRHYDLTGAMAGMRRLLSAQWANGMVPHIIFQPGWKYWWDRRNWRSWVSSAAPPGLATGGITQPPMIAEAVVRIGELLPAGERESWYRSVHGPLVAYHQWLYRERAGQGDGLVVLIHPWETGLDTTPPWLESLRGDPPPWWLRLVVRAKLDRAADHLRWDTRYVPADQRSSVAEALRFYDALRHIRKHRYDAAAILERPYFAVEDLTYNSILIRANVLLRQISHAIGARLPGQLIDSMRKNEEAMETLWDEADECYYSRDARSGRLLREPSIAALMPLYAGCAGQVRAKRMAGMLSDPELFAAPYPVPSVPLSSPWFGPLRYWQGPTWVNTNWLVIDGLRRCGFPAEAGRLQQRTLELVRENGFSEYFHPVTGEPAGVRNFSWTAAQTIDMQAQAR